MRADEFDDLTRQFADGRLSRRDATKMLLFGMVSTGLGWLGLRQTNAYAPVLAGQANGVKGPLPLVQPACSEASRCGSRKYCDEKQGCLCVQAIEGDIRCGKLPDCNTKLCKSSADCASYGAGAFCDTPLSGCCTSPPNTLSRCLLACPPCPAERLCNTNCCAEDQVCRSGKCVPSELCAADPITDASWLAARAAYAAGATDIALSPNGCQRYTRTMGGSQQREYMTLGGFAVLKSHQASNIVMISYDNDRDGFDELDTRITYASGTTRMIVRMYNRYDPVTQKLIGRRSETRRDDTTVDVIVEEWDTAGAVILREQFVASLLAVFPDADNTVRQPFDDSLVAVFPEADSSIGVFDDLAGQTGGPCSPGDSDWLGERLGAALKKGQPCLHKHKHPKATQFGLFRLGGSVNFICDPKLEGAYAHATAGDFPKGPVTITVNPDKMKAPGPKSVLPGESVSEFQARVLFHEVSHFMLGAHSPRTEYYSQFDPTRACDQLCFNPNANQCHCQTCLGTKECADECKALPACSSSIQSCGTRCCVGPCDGASCCPSGRICNKKPGEVATCCAASQVCINLTEGESTCCPANQVCKQANAGDGEEGKEICCQPGETCGQDGSGNPKCVRPQIVCPACPPRNRPARCFPINQVSQCENACTGGGLACNFGCRAATSGECP